MAITYTVRRMDDLSLLTLFEEALGAGNEALEKGTKNELPMSGSGHKINLHMSSGLTLPITSDDVRNNPPGSYFVNVYNLSFTCMNSNQTPTIAFNYRRGNSDSLTDTFNIHEPSSNSAMSGELEQAIQKAILTKLSILLAPVMPEDGGLIPTLSNLTSSFSTTYQQISKELSAALAAVNKERADQLQEFKSERQRLREEIAEEKKQLLRDALNKIDEKRYALKMEQKEIDKAYARLDATSHKDSRRKQFLALQEHLTNSLNQPVADSGLRLTRWAAFLALFAAGIAAAYFAYLSMSVTGQAKDATSTASWLFPAIRSVALTFASLASFLGAAAWLRYFYNRDLQALEEIRRFRNDMARASWVMDASLEIRKEHNEDIPPEWIAGVTEGLFTSSKKDSLDEGAQAVAALMGLSASATFGPNGPKVELSRRGRKAISELGDDD